MGKSRRNRGCKQPGSTQTPSTVIVDCPVSVTGLVSNGASQHWSKMWTTAERAGVEKLATSMLRARDWPLSPKVTKNLKVGGVRPRPQKMDGALHGQSSLRALGP